MEDASFSMVTICPNWVTNFAKEAMVGVLTVGIIVEPFAMLIETPANSNQLQLARMVHDSTESHTPHQHPANYNDISDGTTRSNTTGGRIQSVNVTDNLTVLG